MLLLAVQLTGLLLHLCHTVKTMPRGAPLAPGDLQAANVTLHWLKKHRVVVSPTALHGWMEQTSPACAAASVAGAVQGLLNARGGNCSAERRLSQADAVEVRVYSHSACWCSVTSVCSMCRAVLASHTSG